MSILKVRIGSFETNSSSSHSIIFTKPNNEIDKEIYSRFITKDGSPYKLGLHHFDRYEYTKEKNGIYEVIFTLEDKLNFIIMSNIYNDKYKDDINNNAINDNKGIIKFKKLFKEVVGNDIEFDLSKLSEYNDEWYPYFHEICDIVKLDDDKIKQFLFDENVVLMLDRDYDNLYNSIEKGLITTDMFSPTNDIYDIEKEMDEDGY